MISLQIIAAIATILSVVLMSKENTSGWTWGIIGITSLFFINLHQKLYLQSWLQCVFFIQGLYGFWNWKRVKNKNLKPNLNPYNALKYFGGVLIVSFIISMFFGTYTDAPLPFIDTWTTGMCLLGNLWLANKRIEGWLVWSLVNLLLFFVFFSNKFYISSVVELLLFIISISNAIQWNNRKIKKSLR